MTFLDYLRVARKRWILIVICVALGVGAALAYVETAKTSYQASIQLFVSTPASDSNLSNAFNGSQFGQQRVKSYADIIDTPIVTQPVIAQLKLPYSTGTLAGKISANAPLNTVLVNVNVSDHDPQRAADIANAIGAQAVKAIGQLETPSNGGAAPVRVSVVKQADPPTAPVSPKKKVDIVLGLLGGLTVGICAAVVRELLDRTVSGTGQVEELLNTPTLGVLTFDGEIRKQPLVVEALPRSAQAEAFRQLRTTLRYINVDSRPRSIVVTSAVPGEGKTTVSANLALALAESGLRVLLIDADLRKPRVATTFGVEGSSGLTTLLLGEHSADEVIQPWGLPQSTLWLLAAGGRPPNPSELLGSDQMTRLLRGFEAEYDYVIIDSAPLLPVTDGAVMAAGADASVLVVAHGRTQREHVRWAGQALAQVDAKLVGFVLNMAPASGGGGNYYENQYYNDAETNGRHRRAPLPFAALDNRRPATTGANADPAIK